MTKKMGMKMMVREMKNLIMMKKELMMMNLILKGMKIREISNTND